MTLDPLTLFSAYKMADPTQTKVLTVEKIGEREIRFTYGRPDELAELLKSFVLGIEDLPELISYLCGMQSPELNWLVHPLVNQSEVARRLGISAPLFANKVKQNQYKKFNDEEIAKLRLIRQELLNELHD